MISRQDVFRDLFKLKKAGEDISEQLKIMESVRGVPREVVEFLQDRSPQFQFYRDIKKNQRALMKNVLGFESLTPVGKVKTCSSLITRAMISVEYKNLDESLLEDLRVSHLAKALEVYFTSGDISEVNEALTEHKNAMLLFVRKDR